MTRAAVILGAGDGAKASKDMREVLEFEVEMARAASPAPYKRSTVVNLEDVIHIKVSQ